MSRPGSRTGHTWVYINTPVSCPAPSAGEAYFHHCPDKKTNRRAATNLGRPTSGGLPPGQAPIISFLASFRGGVPESGSSRHDARGSS